jgi:hypothetical protein
MRWLIAAVLVVAAGYALRAQDPGETRKTGKVLLLKNGMALEGDIERIGGEMCVRRGMSEMRIAADQALRLCPDWLDAYAFMRTLIKTGNPVARAKLARWCHSHGLIEEAREQAGLALQLQPDNAEARQLMTLLERSKTDPPATRVERPAAPAPRAPAPVPAVDVAADTLVSFAAKVQPILMNTCAGCHATESAGRFQLQRVYESSHKLATQRNLALVLNYLDVERPAISPLLVKALTPHGREQNAPLKDRNAAPFRTMQAWIVDTIRKNPQLKDYQAARNPAPIKMEPKEKPSTFSSDGTMAPAKAEDVAVKHVPRVEWTAAKSLQAPVVRPSLPQERDWCDPETFNEYYHPRRGEQIVAGR